MIELKDLLSGFKNKFLAEEIKKDTVRFIISNAINIEINSKDLEIKNGEVFLNIKPIYKNEIFLKKDQIIENLNKELGSKAPKI